MERKAGSAIQTLFRRKIGNALCGNSRSQCLDTSLISNQNALTPFQNLRGLCEPMRILVAEDDAPLAEFLHQRLEQEQFAVHSPMERRRNNWLPTSLTISSSWISICRW